MDIRIHIRRIMVVTKVQKWGNSQGIRLPKEALRQINICVGDEVDIAFNGTEIIVKPVYVTRKKYSLKDLLPPKSIRSEEMDWGKASGQEIW
jgi:antitoxin MazE